MLAGEGIGVGARLLRHLALRPLLLHAAKEKVEQAFGRNRGGSRKQRCSKGGGYEHRATPPARMGQDCTQRSLHPTLRNRPDPLGDLST